MKGEQNRYSHRMGRITQKDCKDVEGQNLNLVVNSTSDDAMIVELQNPNYNTEKWGKIKTFVMLVAFIIFSSSMNITNVFIFAIAIVLLLINIFLLMQLVDKETVSIVRNFTFQKTTTRTFGRQQTSMVPCSELKRLVINEIFDNQRVIFMMQLMVQSSSQVAEEKEPKIIPLFENLKPNRECLEFVYKIMKSKLRL